jgi:quercetin dioxygenase-like cupin family protein
VCRSGARRGIFTDTIEIKQRQRFTEENHAMISKLGFARSTAAVVVLLSQAALAVAQDTKVTPLMTKPMPNLASGEKEGVMLTVEYAPGASSAQHRHSAHVFVYVVQGAVVMQVKGGPEVTLTAGQTFYELPEDIHAVSKNASATEPAKIVVFTVKDKGTPLVIPVQ